MAAWWQHGWETIRAGPETSVAEKSVELGRQNIVGWNSAGTLEQAEGV